MAGRDTRPTTPVVLKGEPDAPEELLISSCSLTVAQAFQPVQAQVKACGYKYIRCQKLFLIPPNPDLLPRRGERELQEKTQKKLLSIAIIAA
jgi:hypothetical protein